MLGSNIVHRSYFTSLLCEVCFKMNEDLNCCLLLGSKNAGWEHEVWENPCAGVVFRVSDGIESKTMSHYISLSPFLDVK